MPWKTKWNLGGRLRRWDYMWNIMISSITNSYKPRVSLLNFHVPVAVSLQCFLHCGKWVLWEIFLLWHEVHLVVVSEEKAGILWGQGHDNLPHILLFLLLHTNLGSLDCWPVSGKVQDDRVHLLPLHPGPHPQDHRCHPQYRSGPLVSTYYRQQWYITLMIPGQGRWGYISRGLNPRPK